MEAVSLHTVKGTLHGHSSSYGSVRDCYLNASIKINDAGTNPTLQTALVLHLGRGHDEILLGWGCGHPGYNRQTML